MWLNYENLRSVFMANRPKKVEKDVQNFLVAQEQWARNNVAKHGATDPLWRHTGYILSHLDGLYAGYSKVAKDGWVRNTTTLFKHEYIFYIYIYMYVCL